MEEVLLVPHDIELEQFLIGAMLYDPEIIGEVADILKPRFFYNSKYRSMCQEILNLWGEDEKKVTLVELVPFFDKQGIAISHITDIINSIASTASIRYSAERLRDIAALRAAIKESTSFVSNSSSLRTSDEIRVSISNIVTRISTINEATIHTETMRSAKEVIFSYNEKLEQSRMNKKINGMPSGYGSLDEYITVFEKGSLNIIAGRPGMGKTAFALNLVRNISIRENGKPGDPVAYFSLEMPSEQLVGRMVATVGRINMELLKKGDFNAPWFKDYTQAIGIVGNANLMIDDQPGMTVTEIKAKARRMKREQGLSVIFIDYLGLLEGDGKSEYDIVTKNSRALKNMAMELDVPVICLAQLSRAVEQRRNKRPMMSDLRESGHIEQDSSVIILLYRDEYYDIESQDKGLAEVIVAKNRNGATGTVKLRFQKEQNRFSPLEV